MDLNIKELRKINKFSQDQLADKCNSLSNDEEAWNQGRISHYETGRRNPSLDDLKVIADALNVSFIDLIGEGDIVKEPSSHYGNIEETNYTAGAEKVPEISYVQAGNFSEAIDIYEPGYAEKWHTKIEGGNRTYVLRVKGNSMVSRDGDSFPEGTLIHVDPDVSPNNGSFVIAKLKDDNSVTFKQFKQGELSPYLHPLNFDLPDMYEEFSVLGVIVFSGKSHT